MSISIDESIKNQYCIAGMQYKPIICLIFLNISQLYCPKNAFRYIYIGIKIVNILKIYGRKNVEICKSKSTNS